MNLFGFLVSRELLPLLPTMPFRFVLRLPRRNRLPLHVRWRICPAAFQRPDMVDHISRAASRRVSVRGAGMFPFEGILRCSTAHDSSVRIPGDSNRGSVPHHTPRSWAVAVGASRDVAVRVGVVASGPVAVAGIAPATSRPLFR